MGSSPRKQEPKNGLQLALRINATLARALDAEVARRQAERVGSVVHRAEVVRDALAMALLPSVRSGVKRAGRVGEGSSGGRQTGAA